MLKRPPGGWEGAGAAQLLLPAVSEGQGGMGRNPRGEGWNGEESLWGEIELGEILVGRDEMGRNPHREG